jgi:mediator of RNA polymerase II transcription subunit 14
MWHVTRSDCDPNARNENDDFNKVLKQRVWSASGSGFKGLSTGAAAHPDQGIENLIALIGETILSMVSTPPPSRPQLQQQQQQPQPQPQMQQQPQPQQIMSGPQRGAWTQHS